MAPRAVWKGYLKVAEVTCPVSLYTAVSSSDRIAFHTLNRATKHRVHRVFFDGETGKPVPKEDQVKGYELGQGDYIVLEPDEIASALPESDKTMAVQSFVTCKDIDDLFLDRPYFLAPSDKAAESAYAVIRDGLSGGKVAALAQAILFRRVRTVLVRAHDGGLIASLLNFDYEVRSAREAFDEVPDLTIKEEMLGLAEHIIRTKMGRFDPKSFDDRYENAVAEMVRAKVEGRPLKIQAPKPADKVVDLMAALRESAKALDSDKAPKKASGSRSTTKKPAAARKTAALKQAAAAEPRRKAG